MFLNLEGVQFQFCPFCRRLVDDSGNCICSPEFLHSQDPGENFYQIKVAIHKLHQKITNSSTQQHLKIE
jgi:hypothetical protein